MAFQIPDVQFSGGLWQCQGQGQEWLPAASWWDPHLSLTPGIQLKLFFFYVCESHVKLWHDTTEQSKKEKKPKKTPQKTPNLFNVRQTHIPNSFKIIFSRNRIDSLPLFIYICVPPF